MSYKELVILFTLILIENTLMALWIFFINRFVIKINNRIRELDKIDNKKPKKTRRNHSTINPVSFSNPIQSRKYKEYENEKGLYEPVKPRKGIEIKEDN